MSMSKDQFKINGWVRFGMRVALSSFMHPFYMSQTLMQIGHEPIRARIGQSLTGAPILMLPNIAVYWNTIRRTHGFWSCYRGMGAAFMGSVVSALVVERIDNIFNAPTATEKDNGEDRGNGEYVVDSAATFKVDDQAEAEAEADDGDSCEDWVDSFTRDLLVSVGGIIVSQPFRVISNRMIAQMLGKEPAYATFWGTVREIFQTEGWQSFFAGLVPELFHDVAFLTLSSGTMFLCNKYLIKDKVISSYSNGVIHMASAWAVYPLRVVATCMSISGANMKAATPPFMPEYAKWYDCFYDLDKRGALFRGSRPFWRSNDPNAQLRNLKPPKLEYF